MNIAFFVSSLSVGGAEKQTVADANLLMANAGHLGIDSVHLLTFAEGPLKRLLHPGVRLEVMEKGGYIPATVRLANYIRKNRIGMVHAALFAPMTISAMASLLVKTRVVWHFHSHEYDNPLRSRLAFRLLARLKGVSKIFFVNRELQEHFASYDFPSHKKGVMYNHSEIENEAAAPRKPRGAVNIGYVGRVVALKRVHYLVELAGYLKEKQPGTPFVIHIVGDGEELARVKGLVADRQLEEVVRLHGFSEDTAAVYKKLDIFVNPSSEECLSMAMIDAGMTGLPVVAFNVGGNDEIVLHGKTGYIAGNKEEFFRYCSQLLADGELRAAFGRAAHAHCSEMFSMERRLRNLSALYQGNDMQ